MLYYISIISFLILLSMINDSLNKEEFESFPVVGITMSMLFSGDGVSEEKFRPFF